MLQPQPIKRLMQGAEFGDGIYGVLQMRQTELLAAGCAPRQRLLVLFVDGKIEVFGGAGVLASTVCQKFQKCSITIDTVVVREPWSATPGVVAEVFLLEPILMHSTSFERVNFDGGFVPQLALDQPRVQEIFKFCALKVYVDLGRLGGLQ